MTADQLQQLQAQTDANNANREFDAVLQARC